MSLCAVTAGPIADLRLVIFESDLFHIVAGCSPSISSNDIIYPSSPGIRVIGNSGARCAVPKVSCHHACRCSRLDCARPTDESLAHQRVQDTFRRLCETIASHGGVAHEIRGDALVAEFSRASDAGKLMIRQSESA